MGGSALPPLPPHAHAAPHALAAPHAHLKNCKYWKVLGN